MKNDRADKAFQMRDFATAAALYAARAPADRHAAYRLGLCHFRLKDIAAARASFRAAIDRHPEDARSWYYLGLTAEREDDDAAAIAAYRMALRLDPKQNKALENLTRLGAGPDASPPDPPPRGDKPETCGDLLLSGRRRISSYIPEMFLTGLFCVAVSFVLWEMGITHITAIHAFVIGSVLLGVPLAVIHSRFYRWKIYEYRIDLTAGWFYRRSKQIWLYEITDSEIRRHVFDVMTNTARLRIVGESKVMVLKGIAPAKRVTEIWDNLRTAVRSQRGEIKKMWI